MNILAWSLGCYFYFFCFLVQDFTTNVILLLDVCNVTKLINVALYINYSCNRLISGAIGSIRLISSTILSNESLPIIRYVNVII